MSFSFFDKTYCIHLPNPERRKLIEAEFQRVGIAGVQYVHAAPPAAPFQMANMRRNSRVEFGINLSHMLAVSMAIRDDAQRALFLEDDIRFDRDPTAALAELPDSWKLVFLGGHPRGPVTRYSGALVRISAFSFAEAYGLTWIALREFQEFWFSRIGQPQAMYDFCLSDYAKTHEAYACYPLVTHQVSGISQVSGKPDDKGPLTAKGWATNLA